MMRPRSARPARRRTTPARAAALAACCVVPCAAQDDASAVREPTLLEREAQHYVVEHIPPPPGAVLEVGGLDWLGDGRLVVSTRRGQVWIVSDVLADDPSAARFTLFAEGLHEGLGLSVIPGADGAADRIVVLQRGELTELVDEDGDGAADTYLTLSDAWGVSGNYHEFAFGLPRDDAGRFYVSLNTGFLNPEWWHGKSIAPYRGWLLRIDPDTGRATPVASGLRSPCGLGFDARGELFVTDNQGDWMPACPIFHVREGAFFGHPASLAWTPEYQQNRAHPSDMSPPDRERAPAAVWLPYKWSRSAGNLAPDTTNGRFGPFAEQIFVAELTNGELLRVQMESVQGQLQGAAFRFRQRIGSLARVLFAEDGTLIGGMTNRGWGGLPPADGLVRVRWTGRPAMEMHTVHLLQDGFEITFTDAVADDCVIEPGDVTLTQYDYDLWWEYGSPERNTRAVDVLGTQLSEDRRRLTVTTAGLSPAMVARLVLRGVRAEDGSPLLHDEFAYTINQLPDGPWTDEHVAKVADPPPPRTSADEGWLRLTYHDALDAWTQRGWELVDAEVDPRAPTTFMVRPGNGAVVNTAGRDATDFTSRFPMGDGRYHVEFMLPEGGRAGVFVQGRYGVHLADDAGDGSVQPVHGALMALADGTPARPPAFAAYQGAGTWHVLTVDFRAPRFDAEGRKIADAVLERVRMDDVLLHEDVTLTAPSAGAPDEDARHEAALGPLVIRAGDSPVALRTLRFRPTQNPRSDDGWVAIYNGDDLRGWRLSPDVEDEEQERWEPGGDVLIGGGTRSHLFSPRGDYRDFEVRARVSINDGGNSGLYLRTAYGPGWPKGYEAQINASMADPQKTGSLYGLAPVKVELVPPGTWFDYHVVCRDEDGGTRITIAVNGVVVTDHLDTERRHAAGHIALQQHHDGSRVRFTDLRVRVLE